MLNQDEELKRKVQEQMAAAQFKKNNGIITRTINLMFKTRWFALSDLKVALTSWNISKEDILDTLDYMEGKSYIQARDVESKRTVEVLEADEDKTEIKLMPEGKLITLGIVSDPGIDL